MGDIKTAIYDLIIAWVVAAIFLQWMGPAKYMAALSAGVGSAALSDVPDAAKRGSDFRSGHRRRYGMAELLGCTTD